MKIIKYIFISIVLFFIFNITVNAAATLKVNKANVIEGESFTVTLSSYAATWNLHVTASGPVGACSIKQADGTDDLSNISKTWKTDCKTTGPGVVTVKLSGDTTNDEGITSEVSITKIVTVSKKTTAKATTTIKPSTSTTTSKSNTRKETTTSKITTRKETTTSKITTRKETTTTKIVTTNNVTTTTTEPVTTTIILDPKIDEITTTTNPIIKSEIKNLKIVGYDLNYDYRINEYTINVSNNVNELYVVLDSNTNFSNTGVVNIKNLDYFLITSSDNSKTIRINIRRDNIKDYLIRGLGITNIIMLCIFVMYVVKTKKTV